MAEEEEVKDEVEQIEDLIAKYNEYLELKPQTLDLTALEDQQKSDSLGTVILQDLDKFDYLS